jgi:hypothetical protein
MNGELTTGVSDSLYTSQLQLIQGGLSSVIQVQRLLRLSSALIEAGVKSQIIYEKLYHNKHTKLFEVTKPYAWCLKFRM